MWSTARDELMDKFNQPWRGRSPKRQALASSRECRGEWQTQGELGKEGGGKTAIPSDYTLVREIRG
jgi:hypothetical protein